MIPETEKGVYLNNCKFGAPLASRPFRAARARLEVYSLTGGVLGRCPPDIRRAGQGGPGRARAGKGGPGSQPGRGRAQGLGPGLGLGACSGLSLTAQGSRTAGLAGEPPGMHGPIEVFSRNAVITWSSRHE